MILEGKGRWRLADARLSQARSGEVGKRGISKTAVYGKYENLVTWRDWYSQEL